INYKGGTGKTTTTVSLAHGLANRGQKVLVIDTDSHGSLSYYLGARNRCSLYDLLLKKVDYKECISNVRKNMDIISANNRLYAASIAMAKLKQRETILLDKLSQIEGYDYIIIDCTPTMNLINQNALICAPELFVPVSMEYLSLVGVRQLLSNIKILNKIFKKDVFVSKIIPTFYDKRNNKSKVVLESLGKVFKDNITTPIRSCIALSEAPTFKKTIFEYNPKSPAAADYEKLINEVL
ncbi:ParA family protein, partial [Candidatus Margulisiibacteriota bacterium]